MNIQHAGSINVKGLLITLHRFRCFYINVIFASIRSCIYRTIRLLIFNISPFVFGNFTTKCLIECMRY